MKKLILITVLCLFTLQCEQGWIKDIIVPPVEGCTDSNSCNYNSEAEDDDGSCIAKQGCNEWCEGDAGIVLELDCQGNCGGSNYIDNCGICVLNSTHACTQDCFGNWGGNGELDNCGNCIGEINPFQCELDCAGVWGGTAVVDACDTCGGSITDTAECDCDNEDEVRDCAGVCGGTAVVDCAGVCGGTAVDTDGNGICDSDETVYGCTTPSACNFDATATIFDDSCWSATEGCACSDGEGAIKDNCDTCDTDTSNDCGWQVQFEASEDLFGLYFVDANTGFAVGRDGLILRTINGGSNWTSIDGGTSKLLWGIYFVDVNTGWGVGADGTIINTVDGGESWSDQTISGLSNHLRDVFFIDTNTGWVVGNNDKIYKTIDGGSNWTSQATGTDYSFQGVYCIDSNICMITGIDPMASDESIIFRTTDGGINWVLNYVGDGWLRGIYFHENTGWVVGDSGGSSDGASPIINSNDGGLTWSKQSSGIFDTNLNDVYFVDENKGWAVGTKVGGGSVIINTVDGGTSWSTQQSNTNFELRAVHFINDKGWAVGQGGGFILRYIE